MSVRSYGIVFATVPFLCDLTEVFVERIALQICFRKNLQYLACTFTALLFAIGGNESTVQ